MFADRQFYTSISTGILHASASERRRKKLGGTHCGGLEINSHSHSCPRHVLWMEWLSTPPEHPDLLLFPSLLPCHGDDEQHRTDKTNQTGENAKLKRRLSSRFHATFLACLNVCSLTTTTTTTEKKKKIRLLSRPHMLGRCHTAHHSFVGSSCGLQHLTVRGQEQRLQSNLQRAPK